MKTETEIRERIKELEEREKEVRETKPDTPITWNLLACIGTEIDSYRWVLNELTNDKPNDSNTNAQ